MKRALSLILVLVFAVRAPLQGSKSVHQAAGMDTSAHRSSVSTSTPLTPSQIFSRARPSVVVIVASDQKGQREALGSGFIVSTGRIATNHHVVEGMNEAYVVFSDGDVKPVSKVIADSAQQDLIILAVETGKRSALMFGDELSLQQGDSVYALGAPKGLELSFTNGIVSSFRKSNAQFLIQTTAPIAPGSSGGPLFDRTGSVVGVTASMLSDAPGIYFSVGIGDVKRLLRTPFDVSLSLAEWADQQKLKHGEKDPGDSKPSQSDQHDGPSLDATLGWMSDFSKRYGRHVGVSGETQYFDHFQQEQGCDARTNHSVKTENSSSDSVDRFNLRDLDAQNILITDFSTVIFFTVKSYKLIHREQSIAANKLSAHDLSSDYISFDSKESADRFAAALKHAVTLCSSSKNLF
jgi:hypothetical protein